MLLSRGASPGLDLKSPLFIAVGECRADLAEPLLDAGADPNVASVRTGRTPLHEAAEGGQARLVRMLLRFRADAAAADAEGKRPIDLARENGKEDIVEILQHA